MSVTQMKPKTDVRKPLDAPPPKGGERPHSLMGLREEIDRLFDNAFSHIPLKPFSHWDWDFPTFTGADDKALWPKMDVVENAKAFTVTVDLPGMEEKDVEVTLSDHMLTVKGETRREETSEDDNVHLMERHIGKVRRSIRVPEGVDEKKVDATFENGVLVVTLPKVKEKAPKTVPLNKGKKASA